MADLTTWLNEELLDALTGREHDRQAVRDELLRRLAFRSVHPGDFYVPAETWNRLDQYDEEIFRNALVYTQNGLKTALGVMLSNRERRDIEAVLKDFT